MNSQESFRVAFSNLRANKTRTILSVLGIIIGTGAVIVVVSMVNGTRIDTLEQMRAGKENALILRPKYSEAKGQFGRLNMDEVEHIKAIPSVQAAFPDVTYDMDARGRYGKTRATFLGVNHLYKDLYHLEILQGRFITESEAENHPRVCVVGDKLARKLFGFDYPVGQRVRLESLNLEVVGVFREEERLTRMGMNGAALMPMNTLIGIIPNFTIYSIQIRALPGKIDHVKESMQELLKFKKGAEDLYELWDVRDNLKETEKWAREWMLQMAIIAGISLLVGGVGLMNVMLTSVTERTHEIGLRKALGANSRMILQQFMVESMTLSVFGGGMGVFIGVFVSYGLSILSNGKIFIEIMPLSIVLSFIFSIGIGVVFGLYPASKAAQLSPVEALRYE